MGTTGSNRGITLFYTERTLRYWLRGRQLLLHQRPVPVNMSRFILLLIVLTLAVGLGVYYSSVYWLPIIRNSQGNIQVEGLKALAAVAAVLGTLLAGIISAGAAMLNVGLQSRAARSLEQTKKRLEGELQQDNQRFTRELEDHKKRLEGDLDKKRQTLAHELAIKKSELERKLTQLSEAEEIGSRYRQAVGRLRLGEHEADEIEELEKKLAQIGDRLTRGTDLHEAWMLFYQRGVYLNQRAKKLSTQRERVELWGTKHDEHGILGSEFAKSAENVLGFLRNERIKIVSDAVSEADEKVN